MAAEQIESQIATAWRYHIQGQTQAALDEFSRILKQNPQNIDANYGYGLAQRAAGQYSAATQSFGTALDLVKSAASKHNEARREAYGDSEGVRTDPNTIEDDRYMMLSRMISQRIQEIELAVQGKK